MNRRVKASAAIAATALSLTLSAQAGASTTWVCDVPGEGLVTFVTASNAARHGIETANRRAGAVFHDQFGESCSVESG